MSDRENTLKQLSEITRTVFVSFQTQNLNQLITQLCKDLKYASDYKINQTLVVVIAKINAKPIQD